MKLFPHQKQLLEYLQMTQQMSQQYVHKCLDDVERELDSSGYCIDCGLLIPQSQLQNYKLPNLNYKTSMATMDFQLREGASRRTKQRWRAHQAGNCKSNKCKWCKKAQVVQLHDVQFDQAFLKNIWQPANNEQAENRLKRKPVEREVVHLEIEHPRCTCSTKSLLAWGCTCDYFKKTQELDKPSEPGIIHSEPKLGNNPCLEIPVTMTRTIYCISCHKEVGHYWNQEQRQYECDECGLLALHVEETPETPADETQEQEEDAVEMENSEHELEIIPTADEVLELEVANNYQRAAKRVARSKAEVEVYDEALIPGMMVWHRYGHHSAILLEETEEGVWSIQTKDGNEEHNVKAAILTPVAPNIFIRFWMGLKATLAGIFYREVEESTQQGVVIREEFDSRIVATGLLGIVLATLAAFLGKMV